MIASTRVAPSRVRLDGPGGMVHAGQAASLERAEGGAPAAAQEAAAGEAVLVHVFAQRLAGGQRHPDGAHFPALGAEAGHRLEGDFSAVDLLEVPGGGGGHACLGAAAPRVAAQPDPDLGPLLVLVQVEGPPPLGAGRAVREVGGGVLAVARGGEQRGRLLPHLELLAEAGPCVACLGDALPGFFVFPGRARVVADGGGDLAEGPQVQLDDHDGAERQVHHRLHVVEELAHVLAGQPPDQVAVHPGEAGGAGVRDGLARLAAGVAAVRQGQQLVVEALYPVGEDGVAEAVQVAQLALVEGVGASLRSQGGTAVCAELAEVEVREALQLAGGQCRGGAAEEAELADRHFPQRGDLIQPDPGLGDVRVDPPPGGVLRGVPAAAQDEDRELAEVAPVLAQRDLGPQVVGSRLAQFPVQVGEELPWRVAGAVAREDVGEGLLRHVLQQVGVLLAAQQLGHGAGGPPRVMPADALRRRGVQAGPVGGTRRAGCHASPTAQRDMAPPGTP